jgi:hypothetical protein
LVAADTNDLTSEQIVTYTNQLVHGNTNHLFGDNDGARDRVDLALAEALVAGGSAFRRHLGQMGIGSEVGAGVLDGGAGGAL